MRNLYILFVIHNGSRKIVHFNITFNPTEDWVIQQFREAFPGEHGCKYLIMDRDTKFSEAVRKALKEMGVKPKRTPARKPWLIPLANAGLDRPGKTSLIGWSFSTETMPCISCVSTPDIIMKIELTSVFKKKRR